MKRTAMILGLLVLCACESERPLGKCVGINGEKDSALVYEYSTQNIIIGILGMEMVFPPVIVVLDELECPARKRVSK